MSKSQVQTSAEVGRTFIRIKKTGYTTRNLVEKGPKFTILAALQPEMFFARQPWWSTFLKTLSHLAKKF